MFVRATVEYDGKELKITYIYLHALTKCTCIFMHLIIMSFL